MTHTYNISGMTCSGCTDTVKKRLMSIEGVTSVEVSRDPDQATVTMQKHIALGDLQKALGDKYGISAQHHNETAMQAESWLQTYKPVLLIFTYITAITLLVQLKNETFDAMEAMRHFMAGFFLTFSFFKMLDLKGFAESYVMYDVIARRIPAWAYLYAFVELGLGVANLINFSPTITNWTTLIVMSVSIIGVLQTVLNKKAIRCACLGAVFNLPMSTVTIIEDGLMIAMSAAMLWMM